jgi:thiol:disulfide interchange protein DsbG
MSAAQKYELAATAHGFSVGPLVAAHTAYVFFDPLCPHCAALWESAKSLSGKVRTVWIPAGLLAKASTSVGGAILAADNPMLAMDEHETKVLNSHGSIALTPQSHPAAEQWVKENTDIFKKTGEKGVPLLLYKNAQSGAYGVASGEMSTDKLAYLLGL